MASLDEIFYKEFELMMRIRKGISGNINLRDIPMPSGIENEFVVEKRDKVIISGIEDEYYGKLNGQECLLWGRNSMSRRKFDHNGEYMKDKNGSYIYKDVTCPTDCVGVVSDVSIGVPLKYKTAEKFEYVDMITKTNPDGSKWDKFLYIVPRKYCYKMNQTALVLSWNKLRIYYSGIALSLQNGHIVYMYIIPYKPSDQLKNYWVLHCKTTDDYTEEIKKLRDFWVSHNVMFNPSICSLVETVRGRQNMAFQALDGVLDVYQRFDLDNSLDKTDDIQQWAEEYC